MGSTLRMESRRIATLGTIRVLALAAVLLGTAAAAFVAATDPPGALSGDTATAVLTGAGSMSLLPLTGLLVVLIGVTSVLEDTQHRLATVLLVAQPRRTTLAGARLTVLASITGGICLLLTVLTFLTAQLLGRPIGAGQVPDVFVAHLVTLVLLCWAGAALGWLTGTAAVPVGLVLLDVLLVEPLSALAASTYSPGLEELSVYLPFTAARDATGGDPAALATTCAYTAVLLTASALRITHRDY
ncbi:hypothetical protein KIH74_22100 [Kineosporia sp. J2-2]|uniref:ABC-2 family transporter n=1 Tax=Kineosporia corallincola TaxID=2835133 RepID=A0ABS5TKL6_9ACTN|nr:hypothetical protein [Kineosporia corallincola]MBT0771648.1 hypothetical protein [Kineosporia corallincola]